MKNKVLIVFLVNLLLEATTLPGQGWVWEEEDPFFLTSQKPTRLPKSTTPLRPIPTKPNPTFAPTPISTPTMTPPGDKTFRRCLKRCPSTNEYNPICGTDTVTYGNEGKLVCAKKCGVVVDKLSEGVCGSQTTTTRTTMTTSQPAATANPVCLKRCPKTTEYNPLCGSDNMTYVNEGRLRCAQQCGADVQKRFDGPCGSPTTTTTTVRPLTRTTTLPTNFRACVRQCIVSPSYQPVCSNDGTTYNNESEMTCDISCGRNVQKARDGAC